MQRLAIVLITGILTATLQGQVPCGDCDGNGSVSAITDALLAAQISAGLHTPTLTQGCACDVDRSGAIAILDALQMAQYAAGLLGSLNCISSTCGCILVTCGATLSSTVGPGTGVSPPVSFTPGAAGDATAFLADFSGRPAGASGLLRLTNLSDDCDLFLAGSPGVNCAETDSSLFVPAMIGQVRGPGDELQVLDDATLTSFGDLVPFWVLQYDPAPAATFDVELSCTLAPPGSQSFAYTGAAQTFTPPAGVVLVHIVARGAEGAGGAGGSLGGLGGEAEGDLVVVGGVTTLSIHVGGMGQSFNGGALGGLDGGGNGGGATDVRVGGTALANRVITAGGGGGGGGRGCELLYVGGDGGEGGGGTGQPGQDSPNGGGGAGGAPGVGGAAGIGCGGYLGQPGLATGEGGNGQTCCCFGGNFNPGGGGGGGGFTVGGGGGGGSAGTVGCSGNDKGGGGGGGGGTSDVSGVLAGTMVNGVWSGDGEVVISW